jgi:type III pantothenate kinase
MASGLPEPFGGVTLEAMALGKPVVGTAIGGTVEQIEDGVSGLLVPPNDPDAMAAALKKLLDDPALRLRMGQAGRVRLEERFCFTLHYKRIMQLYHELLKER